MKIDNSLNSRIRTMLDPRTILRVAFLLILILKDGKSLPKPEIEELGYGMSDLFLQSPYFLGAPPSLLDSDEDDAMTFTGLNPRAIVDPSPDKSDGGSIVSDETDLWPGHQFPSEIRNQGSDVIAAYQENFKRRSPGFNNASDLPFSQDFSGRMLQCDETAAKCNRIKSDFARATCHLECLTKDNEKFNELTDVVYESLKSWCQTRNTFFTNMIKWNIPDFDVYKGILVKLGQQSEGDFRGQTSMTGALTQLIEIVKSDQAPFRGVIKTFDKLLKKTETSLGIQGRLLIDTHPGCSMIDLNEPIKKVMELILRDPSLTDYLVFQGYALFSGLTKYVKDFQSKNKFAVITEALSIMTGTTCGILSFANTGDKGNCDQYGAFPVLNMPIPSSIWTNLIHESCELTKKRIFEKVAQGGNAEESHRRRKRRSLAVGGRRRL